MALDLNSLRDQMIRNQERGTTHPSNKTEKVFVDNEGKIVAGTDVDSQDSRPVSEVPQETFASYKDSDVMFAAKFMPTNTKQVSVDGCDGFYYVVKCEYGNEYGIFVYEINGSYEAMLVKPAMEKIVGAHQGHLFSDGKLCLSQSNLFTLGDAYTKSVLWATGASVVRQGHPFPFAYDQ